MSEGTEMKTDRTWERCEFMNVDANLMMLLMTFPVYSRKRISRRRRRLHSSSSRSQVVVQLITQQQRGKKCTRREG